MEFSNGLKITRLNPNPKRRRICQPSKAPSSASTFTSQQYDVDVKFEDEPVAPTLSPARSIPLPVMFVNCEDSVDSEPGASNSQPSLPPRTRSNLNDKQVSDQTTYGSDESCDDIDEQEMVPFQIPRVYRSMIETPLDLDEGDVATEYPEPASDPEHEIDPKTLTEQPWSWCDFEWKTFPDSPIPPESRRETFSQSNVGPTTPSVDPYDIFTAIWDRQIMEHIVAETNKYAQQVAEEMLRNHSLHPSSRINQWSDTTVDDLYVYFALILAMGVVIKSRLAEYWSSDPDVFYTPGFSAHMSYNRFLLLNKFLHFNDNNDIRTLKLNVSEAKLYKIQPIVSFLNSKFQDLYIPPQNIAVDESLLMWKGWLDINQRRPDKVDKKSIKSYEICESQTGYLWRFEIHANTRSLPQHSEDPLEASTPSIVLRLIEGLEHKGYTLWMDNYYNSPCLARRLKSLGFDCAGTLRTDRKFVPQTLHSLTKENMRPGEISALTSGDVDVMVWRDNNRVAMISTYHGNGQQTIGGTTKPILIYDYNIMMGGLDKKDQLLAMYPVERKRTKVWYKKLFRRLLNISVLNSYVIYHHNSSSSLPHRKFRINLVKSLLSKHNSSSQLRPVGHLPKPNTSTQINPSRIDVSHRLAEFPMVSRQRHRRQCSVCKKRVSTFCVACTKTVCIDPCFLKLHS